MLDSKSSTLIEIPFTGLITKRLILQLVMLYTLRFKPYINE